MSEMKLPLSRRHLDIAIERLASRFGEAQRIRRRMVCPLRMSCSRST